MKTPSKPSIHVPYNLLAFLVKMAPKECLNEFLTEKLQSYRYLHKNQQFNSDLEKRVEYALNWVQDFEEIRETPVNLTEAEEKAVLETLRSKWISTGPKTVEFENQFVNIFLQVINIGQA